MDWFTYIAFYENFALHSHLRASQKAWIKFRDAEFDFINSTPDRGTLSLLIDDESRLEIVKSRVMQLRKHLSVETDNP